MTGDTQDGYIIGVSEEVPEPIKDHFAVSEHDEFMVYGLDDMDRTIHSEQNMLRILKDQEKLKKMYTENKILLYDYMIKKAKGNLEEWKFTEEDYKGFQRATEFLKSVSS